MWDNHQMLGSLANALFALAALIAAYFLGKWVINLPILPLKAVSVSSSGHGVTAQRFPWPRQALAA